MVSGGGYGVDPQILKQVSKGINDALDELKNTCSRRRAASATVRAPSWPRSSPAAPPAEPESLDRLKRQVGNTLKNQLVGAEHQLGGVLKTGTSMLRLARTVNPLDPYTT
ncbi:hypothetical protein SCANM124S_05410 [Streptomyces canus]